LAYEQAWRRLELAEPIRISTTSWIVHSDHVVLAEACELERIGGRYALVTMCIGGGQGIAAIFERTA